MLGEPSQFWLINKCYVLIQSLGLTDVLIHVVIRVTLALKPSERVVTLDEFFNFSVKPEL